MHDEVAPKLVVASKNDNDEFQLSSRERVLIRNFRAMKGSARDMLVDLSEQYKRTLPAEPVKLRLLGTRE
jgi:hypothetical protein